MHITEACSYRWHLAFGPYAYNMWRQKTNLHHRGLAARGESVSQTALATVLAIFVEGHLQTEIK